MGTKVTRQDRNPKLHLTCMKYYLEQHLAREDKTEKKYLGEVYSDFF